MGSGLVDVGSLSGLLRNVREFLREGPCDGDTELGSILMVSKKRMQ